MICSNVTELVISRADMLEINAKKTTVYTYINGDKRSHIENRKKLKKLYYYNAAHRYTSVCSSGCSIVK